MRTAITGVHDGEQKTEALLRVEKDSRAEEQFE